MLVLNLKALVVVLGIALAVFFVVKPTCLRFMTAEAFKQRRNLWLLLTVAAFVSPNFWLFSALTAVLVWRLARHEPNPIALYIFLAFLVPPVRYGLSYGTFGIADLTLHRLLALVILVPWMLRHLRATDRVDPLKAVAVDRLVLLFGALQVISMLAYEPVTRTVLRALLYFLDVYVVYYVASRSCTRKEQLVEFMACLTLACALLAPLAVFEAVRTWPLYGGVSIQWGAYGASLLFREGMLRPSVTTGHALTLGYFAGIGFGFWLYLSSRGSSRMAMLVGVVWMWAGLIAAYSRAPWLMAVLFYLTFALIGAAGASKFVKALLTLGVLATVVLLSPAGDRIVDLLPFIGTVESKNVEYRQTLVETTWVLVQQNPLFGNRFVAQQTEELMNGQGILDLVNAYAAVALYNGLVGLALFVGAQLIALVLAFNWMRRMRAVDPDAALIGANLVTCMIATVFFQATSGPVWMHHILVGLLVAYTSICMRHDAQDRSRYGVRRAGGVFAARGV